jgi:hypothetical protein
MAVAKEFAPLRTAPNTVISFTPLPASSNSFPQKRTLICFSVPTIENRCEFDVFYALPLRLLVHEM